MKTKLSSILSFFLMLCITTAFAQEKTISGEVQDSSGLPLPGVNIILKNTSLGTQSDFDGKYTISASVGQTLIFSYVGFVTQEIAVTDSSNVINVNLLEAADTLEEVVVTAQGIKREKKALGFGQTTVKSEALESRPSADVAKVLQGKVSGVQISQTGVAGGGTGITIRGNTAISGNNQALIVVDGIPINSGSDDDGFTGAGTIDSNRLLDIDPNNIESMSVLKGLAATVLYGNQGINGVIVITTKTGAGTIDGPSKTEITVSSNTYFNEVANLPDFQNRRGSGFYLGTINGANASFGPEFDNEIVPNILSNNSGLSNVFPEFFDDPSTPDIIEGGVPYRAAPNNVKDFFRTGVGRNISIGAAKGFENGSINFNYSKTTEEGFIPNNEVRRDNFSLSGTAKLANKFTVSGAFNYVENDVKAPPITAANGQNAFSIFSRLLFTPRNYDFDTTPFENPVDGSNVYYLPGVDDPRWILKNSLSGSQVNRFFNNVSLNYELNDNINLSYKFGIDSSNERQSFYINRGSSDGNTIYQNGFLRVANIERQQFDHTILLNMDYDLSEKIGLVITAGANSNRRTFFRDGTVYQDQVLFNNQNARNFENVSNIDPFTGNPLDFRQERNIFGVYGQAEVGYNKYLYLTLAARNDWGSLLEADQNSIFYPSASISFIPTTAISGLRSDAINYLKLRANASSGAQFPDRIYSTRPILNQNTNSFGDGGVIAQTVSNFIPNPELKPATFVDYEFGVESKFWNNKISFDASIYKRIASDQIFQQNVPSETGATSTLINIGETETDGIEIDLGISPIRTDNFEWNIRTNFFTYETIVNELPEGTDLVVTGGFNGLGNVAIVGQPLGALYGSFAVRDEATGQFLIDPSNGEVIPNSQFGIEDKIIGDPTPDFTSTIINTLSYKGFTLSGQFEYRQGGDIYSLSAQNLIFRGVIDPEGVNTDFYAASVPGILAATDTAGNIITIDTNNDGVPDGVQAATDANGDVIPNNILLPYEDVIFNNLEQNAAENIYDGTFLRLRELSLSYNLSSKILDKTPFGSMEFKVYGQNLWFNAPNFPSNINYDIETTSTGVGNASGLDFQTAPSTKSYGFSIKASF